MGGILIWVLAAAAYGAFWFWYNGWQGPLSKEEVDTFVGRLQASSSDFGPERLETVRSFLEQDDGREFFMVNLVRLHPEPVTVPGTDEREPARKVLERYTSYFMRALFLRAGHPAFVGRAAGGYVEHWGVESDPGWTMAGVVRYRSRRDMAILASDPRFEPAHVFKVAAMANTLAFPAAPGFAVAGPRVWVALVLALVAALVHLAFRS
jgi:hypothetical protein